MIDHVLKVTGFPKLHYAGHSQGCTSFFVMCSMRPAYNAKVVSMQALAPAVYAKETEDHPYIRAISLYFNVSIAWKMDSVGFFDALIKKWKSTKYIELHDLIWKYENKCG